MLLRNTRKSSQITNSDIEFHAKILLNAVMTNSLIIYARIIAYDKRVKLPVQ